MGSLIRSGDGSKASGPLGGVVALLTARNLAELVLPDAADVPTNVAGGAVLLALARRSGCSWEELGLDRRDVGRGITVGRAVRRWR